MGATPELSPGLDGVLFINAANTHLCIRRNLTVFVVSGETKSNSPNSHVKNQLKKPLPPKAES